MFSLQIRETFPKFLNAINDSTPLLKKFPSDLDETWEPEDATDQ